MKPIETIIKMQLPLKRIPAPKKNEFYSHLPWRVRWFGWLFSWGGGSIGEFGGSRTNTIRHLELFRWHVLTIHRNEYHDRSDKERADEYLAKWSACEKELQRYKIAMLGEEAAPHVKQVLRDAFGLDTDEGVVR